MDAQMIEMLNESLIVTTSESSNQYKYFRARGDHIRISRGIYLHRDVLSSKLTHWQQQEIVAIARVLATMRRMEDVVFCKDTALFLHGIPQKTLSPNVYVRSEHAYGRHLRFPAVWVGEECILPAGKVLVSHAALTHSGNSYVRKLPCVSLQQALVECAAFKRDEEALASASALLSSVARRRGVPREYGEAEAEKIRGEALFGAKTREGLQGRDRVLRIIECASTKCDSVAEAYCVAMLHTHRISGWTQQYEVHTSSGWRFIDFAFPELGLAIEIEGKVKDAIVGRSSSAGHVAYYNRAAELSALGWTVLPIPASDVLYNPMKARQTLHHAFAASMSVA